jgi:hypothetical protein
MSSVFGRVGDTLKNIEKKLGETHKAAVNNFEETFEIRCLPAPACRQHTVPRRPTPFPRPLTPPITPCRGEKTQAQIELEAWNERVEGERESSQVGAADALHTGGFNDKDAPVPRRAHPVDLDDMSAPPSAAFSLETVALPQQARSSFLMTHLHFRTPLFIDSRGAGAQDEPAPPRSPRSTHLDPTAAAAAASALRQVAAAPPL